MHQGTGTEPAFLEWPIANFVETSYGMCVSLNQWMALTPPELVQQHLNLDAQTLAALRKDKPVVVGPRDQRKRPTP